MNWVESSPAAEKFAMLFESAELSICVNVVSVSHSLLQRNQQVRSWRPRTWACCHVLHYASRQVQRQQPPPECL